MANKKQNFEDLNAYHWFYEPDNISIRISQEFRKSIFKSALEKAKSMTNLSRLTGLSKQTLFNNMYGISMNIKGFKKLLNLIKINFMEVYEHIEKIGGNKIKLPIRLDTPESAIIFASILGDGSNTSRVMYKNKDIFLINKIEKCVRDWLGNVIIDHRISSKNIPCLFLPRITGRIFSFVGIPVGKQTRFNPGIPEVIKSSGKSVKKAFIQQFFDDEGWPEPNQMRIAISQCIYATPKLPEDFVKSIRNKEIVYLKKIPSRIKEMINAPEILIDLKRILENDFEIYSNIRLKRLLVRERQITGAFELEIQRKEDVKKFFREINFSSPTKKKKLDFMVNRNRELPSNIMLLIINEAIRLSKGKGYFLACDIAKNLGFPQPPIRKRLTTLVRKGIFNKRKMKFFINIEF
ncbi:hypothetical protein KY366_04440 [Candidatus Woesearchaeota archaeon]|nr:hypothetical protein [Candidatus Woesearchaeota archaeon]